MHDRSPLQHALGLGLELGFAFAVRVWYYVLRVREGEGERIISLQSWRLCSFCRFCLLWHNVLFVIILFVDVLFV